MRIDGKKIAQDILKDLSQKVTSLRKKGITPRLAIVTIDNDPASKAYVRQKQLKGLEIGVKVTVLNYESRINNNELLKTIEQLNNDNNVHGIIIQRPLPAHIDSDLINKAIKESKDVDAFRTNSKFEPPIAKAVLRILEIVSDFDIRISNFLSWLRAKKVVILGKGETGGGPIIKRLKELGIKPTVIDTKTHNQEPITREADIIISAVGKPNIITPGMIKKGVILISVGLSKNAKGNLIGDYDEDDIKNKASFYTPTPGGVGPVNVACLLENLVKSAQNYE